MKPLNITGSLWCRRQPAEEPPSNSNLRETLVRGMPVTATSNPLGPEAAVYAPILGGPETPICCWNLCGNYAGKKAPRPVPGGTGTDNREPWASGANTSRSQEERLQSGGASRRAQADQLAGVFSGDLSAEERGSGKKGGNGKMPSFTSLPVASALEPPFPQIAQPGTPASGLETTFRVADRVLIERVGTDRHLAFNAVSGAVDVLDDRSVAQLAQLRRGDPVVLTPDREASLRARGYLLNSRSEEEQVLSVAVTRAWERMQASQPEMYTVCPTLACNLACAYCFEGDSLRDKQQGVMTEQQVDYLFEAVGGLRRTFAGRGQTSDAPPWIALFGGEPLLPSTQRCVAQILRRAGEQGFLVGATTNGVNVTRYERLLTEYADILTTFQVTLDGQRAVHDARRHRLGGQGTFDEIVRGIDLLLFLGVEVDLRVNLDRTNLPDLPGLVDFIFERGWNGHPGFALALAGVTGHGAAGCGSAALPEMELAQSVMALMKTHPRLAEICHLGFLRHLDYLVSVLEPEKRRPGRGGAGIGPRYWYCEASTDKQFVFTPEGLIYSCTEAVGKPDHAIGSFVPTLELWQDEAKQWIGRTILSHPKCHACSISTLCGGGCHFAAREKPARKTDLLQISVKGRPMASVSEKTEPFCNAAEETVRAYLRHIGQQLDHRPTEEQPG